MPTPAVHAPRHAPRVRLGCDVHPVAELAESVDLFGERYLARVFTPLEREQCEGPAQLDRLAGRFAAKEAVVKVLELPPTAAVPWHDIEVRTGRNGVPFVVLAGQAAQLALAQGIERIDVSLSHDAGIAMAVAAAMPVVEPAGGATEDEGA
ncbi:MAG: holo-ACP synthase [Microbacteriaceae bacterium]|nr:holo-ACP synthase [Microbacteriaceae bacterium]